MPRLSKNLLHEFLLHRLSADELEHIESLLLLLHLKLHVLPHSVSLQASLSSHLSYHHLEHQDVALGEA